MSKMGLRLIQDPKNRAKSHDGKLCVGSCHGSVDLASTKILAMKSS